MITPESQKLRDAIREATFVCPLKCRCGRCNEVRAQRDRDYCVQIYRLEAAAEGKPEPVFVTYDPRTGEKL